VLTHNLAAEVGIDRYALRVFATKHPGADPHAVAGLGYEVVTGDLTAHLRDPDVRYDVVVLARPDNYDAFAADVRLHQPQAAIVYLAEALFAVRLEREAALAAQAGNAHRASELRKQAEASWRVERRAVRGADRVVSVSPEECERLRAMERAAPVDLVFPLQDDVAPTSTEPGDRDGILYVSSWTARDETSPNADGMRWFCEAVLPIVAGTLPWARLRATGSNPPPGVADFAGAHVEFTGFVPDLRTVYESSRVVIVPLRFGAGVKNKTVEALQYGVPVVTTSIGAEGIDVPAGLAPMVVADDPAEFATAVIRLLTDGHEWRQRRADSDALRAHWTANRGRRWVSVLDDALATRRAREASAKRETG